ncbi:MAG: peptidoglycan DD-metalloendopeptidase family protein [Actinobacteria bacterium]|uniref:Unannotated protein n=1 Tax=freshwater metagenome TaxID=449393 RepID=A0A6J6RH87_9ZZZZ|nr:peptidoglycan DD-metalloendopeptidase family protein [Actinomycetota bacterium]
MPRVVLRLPACALLAVAVLAATPGTAAWAAPTTDYEMPFPCGQSWTGTTRSGHSPSVRSIDWNRVDDVDDAVVAAAPGVVTTASLGSRGYGNYVVVDHGSSESSLYAHLATVLVSVGQRVDQGAQLGTLGATGNATGPHLHFEERLDRAVQEAWFHGGAFVYGTTQSSANCVDVPLAGDFVDGAPAELVVYRRAARSEFRVQRPGLEPMVLRLGSATDEPVVGDWDGDGKANPGVRRPSSSTFVLKAGGAKTMLVFGEPGDAPVAGDWDGDRRWEVGVWRSSTAQFLQRGADGSVLTVALGESGDLPVTGDWDGNGTTDLGVYDQSTATFTLRRVDDDGLVWTAQVVFGDPGDLPVVGDWDGNLKTDVGVWDPATATFSERQAPTPTAARAERSDVAFGRPR